MWTQMKKVEYSGSQQDTVSYYKTCTWQRIMYKVYLGKILLK